MQADYTTSAKFWPLAELGSTLPDDVTAKGVVTHEAVYRLAVKSSVSRRYKVALHVSAALHRLEELVAGAGVAPTRTGV